MAQGTFSKSFKSKFLEDFIVDVANTSTSYFITFGKYDEWPTVKYSNNAIISDDSTPPATNNSLKTAFFEVYRNILYGKQFNETNVSYVIKDRKWSANTTYDYYDDRATNLYDKNFYVVNSSGRVYKCLFNNYGAKSTIEPVDFNPNGDFVTLPDGYKWKYMYRVDTASKRKFSLDNAYIPVKVDDLVQSYAVDGAIHTIIVDNGGTNYPSANGVVVDSVNDYTFRVAPAGIETINNIYKDSAVYIYAGTGNNFISTITNYTVNTSGNYITTQDAQPGVDSTSRYRVGPSVSVVGDGAGVKAFAYVNQSLSKSVYKVDVIKQGSGYTYADVTLVSNSIALGTGGQAAAHAVISPPGGHGYNTIDEFGCDTVAVALDVTDPIDKYLPNWATYRQVAILSNPLSPDTNEIYNDTYFQQYTTLTMQFYNVNYKKGDTVIGLQSGASGTVINVGTGNTFLTDVKGQFQVYETVQEPKSLVTNVISAINTNDLIPYSGKLLYYKNIKPVLRYSGSREQVKIYFKI